MLYEPKNCQAYVIGGKFNMLKCLTFDFLNQKFGNLASLNHQRSNCGAIKKSSFVWVFGGLDEGKLVDSIERFSFN
tara:strand:- start:124 stop:351 length:228 start_codon:yes stop_codon:yes gene_type:complete